MHEVHARAEIFWNQIRGSDSVLAKWAGPAKFDSQRSGRPAGGHRKPRLAGGLRVSDFGLCQSVCQSVCLNVCFSVSVCQPAGLSDCDPPRPGVLRHAGGASNNRSSNGDRCKNWADVSVYALLIIILLTMSMSAPILNKTGTFEDLRHTRPCQPTRTAP